MKIFTKADEKIFEESLKILEIKKPIAIYKNGIKKLKILPF
jgi:hypothetical protein